MRRTVSPFRPYIVQASAMAAVVAQAVLRFRAPFSQTAESDGDNHTGPAIAITFSTDNAHGPKCRAYLASLLKANGLSILADTAGAPGAQDHGGSLVVTASVKRLLRLSEESRLSIRTQQGDTISLAYSSKKNLRTATTAQDSLSSAQKLRLLRLLLLSITAEEDCPHPLTAGDCVLITLSRNQVVEQVFPLQEHELRAQLKTDWLSWSGTVVSPPFTEINSYFGEKVGFYFAFLQHFTVSLLFPAAASLIFVLYSRNTSSLESFESTTLVSAFAGFNVLWSALSLASWKRRQSRLKYRWGMWSLEIAEEVRPQFKEESEWRAAVRHAVAIFCTGVVFIVCLALLMAVVFWSWYTVEQTSSWLWQLFPTLVYTATLQTLKGVFKRVATFLTGLENHETESQYEDSRVKKLVSLHIASSFVYLFFVAFYLQDLAFLRQQVATVMTTEQIWDGVAELIVPRLGEKIRLHKLLQSSREQPVSKVAVEGLMVPFKTFDEYLELAVQFGNVLFFSAIFPLAPVFALINSLIESRTDPFKLCCNSQRPMPRSAASVGAWESVFLVIAFLGAVVNASFVVLHSMNVGAAGLSQLNAWQYFGLWEHGFTFLLFAVVLLIPRVPRSIQKKIREENRLRQAIVSRSRVRGATSQAMQERAISDALTAPNKDVALDETVKAEFEELVSKLSLSLSKSAAAPTAASDTTEHEESSELTGSVDRETIALALWRAERELRQRVELESDRLWVQTEKIKNELKTLRTSNACSDAVLFKMLFSLVLSEQVQ